MDQFLALQFSFIFILAFKYTYLTYLIPSLELWIVQEKTHWWWIKSFTCDATCVVWEKKKKNIGGGSWRGGGGGGVWGRILWDFFHFNKFFINSCLVCLLCMFTKEFVNSLCFFLTKKTPNHTLTMIS